MNAKRLASALLALALIIGAGLVHGYWADRWTESQELQQAAERLKQIPLKIGEWQGQDLEGAAQNFEQAGAKAYLMRRYTHTRTKASFLLILMCGRPGKMGVHTPDVCYQGAGYEMIDSPQPWTVKTELGDELGTFWTARFGKGAGNELRLFWAWASTGTWEAPREPRWQFRGGPYLYKLYVSHDSHGSAAPSEASQEFLRRILPKVRISLISHAP